MKRNGDWMQTYSGKKFWPLDPRPEEIDIKDIGSSLSKLCRFGGHSKKFYSVAEHSVLISRAVPFPYKLWGLLHDASEAYVQDIIRPLKNSLPEYKKIEKKIMSAIVDRFELTPKTMPLAVSSADVCILNDEHFQVMGGCLDWWHDSKIPLGVNIEFWDPSFAMGEFMVEYYKLKEGEV